MDEVTCPRCHEVFVPGPVRVTESTARDEGGRFATPTGTGAAAGAVKTAGVASGLTPEEAAAQADAEAQGDEGGSAEAGVVGEGLRDPSAGHAFAEAWDEEAHPRNADGEFSTADGKGKTGKDGTLGFDGRAGTGYGKKGGEPKVRELQEALNRLGITDANGKPLAVDGQLGPKTTAAVKKLQKQMGLKPDGKVTPALLAKIKAEAAKKPKPAAKKTPARPSGGKATMKTTPASEPTQSVFARKERMTGGGATVEDRVVESDGRVLEALDDDAAGGRRYRVQVIAYGDSKNGRRYPAQVMREAARLYEGAKAFDHHRSDEALRSGTIAGLVGHYSDVTATETGIEATLTLLPSATHAAEVLDAAIAQAGSPHAAGISHDVRATFKPIQEGRRRLQEATQIVDVMSADIVAHPAAGGLALRAVAGGIDPTDLPGDVPGSETAEESGVTVTTEGVLAALQGASSEQLAELGLARATTETTTAAEPAARTTEADTWAKGSALGTTVVKAMADAANLPARGVEALLPERFSEADIEAAIAGAKAFLAADERQTLAPSGVGSAQVTKEARDKQIEALDATFAGDYSKGFRSFKEAFIAVTGRQPRSTIDEDFNRVVMRETVGALYDSTTRASESGTTSTWAQILGDSITRRMVREYQQPSLQTWRRIVSRTVPINDFRTQRLTRLGGYGILPSVNEGAPYQPLTTPGDEEATYALGKRGGTEDLTMEMVANDDLRAVTRIPVKLGLAAAQTLYRYVWDILVNNAAVTYDSTALFHTNHANTQSGALNQTNLSVLRRRMRQQTAYGDSHNVLSIMPRLLVVPSALEEIAYQLTRSAVAIPSTPAGPSDTPNIHQGLDYEVIDYWSDADDWFVVADPGTTETIEVGFYQGREEPELFTQADATVGSMFNADVLTMKVRHIYNAVVIDHRGFQRATN